MNNYNNWNNIRSCPYCGSTEVFLVKLPKAQVLQNSERINPDAAYGSVDPDFASEMAVHYCSCCNHFADPLANVKAELVIASSSLRDRLKKMVAYRGSLLEECNKHQPDFEKHSTAIQALDHTITTLQELLSEERLELLITEESCDG